MAPAQNTMPIADAVEADPSGRLVSGDIVGDYRIERLIGTGGMASVHSAVHCLLGQRVAIKVLKPTSAAIPTLVERFAREARTLAHLNHRAIPKVITLGKLPSGRLYYVMELLAGLDLGEWLQRNGPVAPDKALPLLREVAEALAAAHESGIVHRDLKPSNVFLCDERSAPPGFAVKLLDFGIAKILEHARIAEPPITIAGGPIVGTPLFMAPEQLRGGEIDARVDVYGLGCLAYTMLSGKAPFRRKDLAQLVRDKHEVALEPLSDVDWELASFDPSIRRALAANPDDRYTSPLELVEALAAAVDHTGARLDAARTTLTTPVAQRAPKKLRVLATLAGAVVGIGLAMFFAAFAGRAPTQASAAPQSIAEAPRVTPAVEPQVEVFTTSVQASISDEPEKPRRVRAFRPLRKARNDDASLELPIRF